jgi:hypothetical protein
MIENFFLDPDVIFEAIESVLDKTSFQTVDDVGNAIDDLLTTSEPIETGRRMAAILAAVHFYPPSAVNDITPRTVEFLSDFQKRYSREAIESALHLATASVEEIRKNERRREEFDGKRNLTEFFRLYLHQTGLSRQVFAFYAARRARRRRSVVQFFDSFFAELAK